MVNCTFNHKFNNRNGIFLSIRSVAKSAGTQAPMIYLVAAVFTSVLAITFASAAKYVTKSGAAYAYVKAAFGNTLDNMSVLQE